MHIVDMQVKGNIIELTKVFFYVVYIYRIRSVAEKLLNESNQWLCSVDGTNADLPWKMPMNVWTVWLVRRMLQFDGRANRNISKCASAYTAKAAAHSEEQ